MKYDLKYLFSQTWIIYIITLVISLIKYWFDFMHQKYWEFTIETEFFGLILGLACSITYLALIIYVTYKIITRFKRNLYEDEAYFTRALPVSKKNLYLSKVLSSLILVIITVLVLGISLLFSEEEILKPQGTLIRMYEMAYRGNFQGIFEDYQWALKINYWLIMVLYIIGVIFIVMNFILAIHFGIIKGSKDNSKIKSILWTLFIAVVSFLCNIIVLKIVEVLSPDINYYLSYKNSDYFDYSKHLGSIRATYLIVYLTIIGNNIWL